MAATNMKEQGKVMVPEAREIVTLPSSSGLHYYQLYITPYSEGYTIVSDFNPAKPSSQYYREGVPFEEGPRGGW
jgi:hypothetical protein